MDDMAPCRRGWIFPGQASQRPGMARDMAQGSPVFIRLLDRAVDRADVNLREVLLDGDETDLRNTLAAQVGMFIVSIALVGELKRHGMTPSVVAGHSLGEFSALVAGGWLDAEPALDAVVDRAIAMRTCCETTDGSMHAVIGLTVEQLEEIGRITATRAVIANRNAPSLSVLSGLRQEVERLAAAAIEAGARATVPLPVSGAFHSPLMAQAQDEFAEVVRRLPLRQGEVPLLSSISGSLVDDVEAYREQLATQMCGPVRWNDVAHRLYELAPDGVVEVGPGRALRMMLREAAPKLSVVACDSLASCSTLPAN
jgi:[acyl-carrier-protein] S-malonyltransferase